MKGFEWTPLKGIGPFEFGCILDKNLCERYDLREVPEEYNKAVGWVVYMLKQDDRLFTEDNKVVSFLCSSKILYHDQNLIGMTIDQVTSLLDSEPSSVESEELSEGVQDVYEFDELGLQLWVAKGMVVTAIVNEEG